CNCAPAKLFTQPRRNFRGFRCGVGVAVGFAVPAGVPVLVVPLPVAGVFVVMVVPVVLVPLFVPPFAGVPFVDPLPFVAGVEEGLGPGREVTGVGTSGIGVDKTFATSSVTFASVPVLLR